MTARVELYKVKSNKCDGTKDWYWRFVKNGRVMADSGQGYSRRIDCINGCATVLGGSCWLPPRGSEDDGDFLRFVPDGRLQPLREDIPIHDLTRQP